MSGAPTYVDLPEAVTPHPLHLTADRWWDTLHCLAFGTVSDGLTHGQRLVVESCGLIYVVAHPETGPVLGFEILDVSKFVLPDDDPEVWDGPRFDVPRLGVVDTCAGEILLAVRAQFGDRPTADALHFHTAIATESPEDAVAHWELALDAGDMRVHFGLGYAHLRRYTELVPANSRAWCWLGECCEALSRRSEARTAYKRAVGDELWKRSNPGEGESMRRYYRSLYDTFCARAVDMGPNAEPLLDELGRSLDELTG